MPESNRIQARIPRGCGILRNSWGSAPGIHYQQNSTALFVLPGVPSEMKAMFETAVLPRIDIQGIADSWVKIAQIRCFGLSEARTGELLEDLMVRDRNPLVGLTASEAVLAVRVVARASSEAEAVKLVDADLCVIRERLGKYVFGEAEESLEQSVARLLVEQNKTVATAESCTGGGLAQRLTDIPGSSGYFFRGYVTYANEAKVTLLDVPRELLQKHGAVSEPVARTMAAKCRQAAGTDFGLSTTGVAGPGGGNPPEKPVGLVYVGLADCHEVKVKRLLLGEHNNREAIRDRACKWALNLLRLRLLELVR